MEKFVPENIFIFISENKGDYRMIMNNFLCLKKGIDYRIKIEFSNKYNQYIIEYFIMNDYNIAEFQFSNITFGRNILKPNIRYYFRINLNEYKLVVKIF